MHLMWSDDDDYDDSGDEFQYKIVLCELKQQ